MTKIQNINFFGQIMLQLDDFTQKIKSELEFWLKNAKLQLWWFLMIFGFLPFNFGCWYFLHGWEKIFLASLIWKNIKKAFRGSWISVKLVKKWWVCDLSKLSKFYFLSPFAPIKSGVFQIRAMVSQWAGQNIVVVVWLGEAPRHHK